jgi:predicted transcriptional regulator
MATSVVCAYVTHNTVAPHEVTQLFVEMHSAIRGILAEVDAPIAEQEVQKPAISPHKSIHEDYLVCLEDGKKFKSLKLHLASQFGMTPEEYRKKWNLPDDYPMVAPGYSAVRSAVAKEIGLGRKAGKKLPPKVDDPSKPSLTLLKK